MTPGPPANFCDFVHPATSRPWYLLFATVLLAKGTIVTAIYLTAMPALAMGVQALQQACQPADTADRTNCTPPAGTTTAAC